MNTKEIRWHLFDRDQVPDALFGFYRSKKIGTLEIEEWALDSGQIAIGFCEDTMSGGREARHPALVLLGKGKESDILSWLNVYASETFPLSQFARVLSSEDWARLRQLSVSPELRSPSEDKWACVALGELLALGDSDVELASLPLSRVAACFSTPMARTVAFHRSEEATRMCAERLHTLEADVRFVRRAVSVAELLPIWALVSASVGEIDDASEVVELVLQATGSHGVMHRSAGGGSGADLLRKHSEGLLSDSVEARVMAYHGLVQSVAEVGHFDVKARDADLVLAAGAFMVGRGTSHAFLLRKSAMSWPTAYAWFGLLAALRGPRGWDPTWSRMAKGIERQLRAPFNWADPSSADLCWPEYSWMTKAFDGGEAFVALPKLLSRVLSVEVMPGAACQLRLAVDAGAAEAEGELRDRQRDGRQERELRAALEQFVGLALRTRSLLERDPYSAESLRRQSSLALDEEKRSKKSAYVRRPGRYGE